MFAAGKAFDRCWPCIKYVERVHVAFWKITGPGAVKVGTAVLTELAAVAGRAIAEEAAAKIVRYVKCMLSRALMVFSLTRDKKRW